MRRDLFRAGDKEKRNEKITQRARDRQTESERERERRGERKK